MSFYVNCACGILLFFNCKIEIIMSCISIRTNKGSRRGALFAYCMNILTRILLNVEGQAKKMLEGIKMYYICVLFH